MERDDVFSVISGERDHQESISAKWDKRGHLTPGEETVLAMIYLKKAQEAFVYNAGNQDMLEMLRKVCAILVRCFEHHGVPKRKLAAE